MIAIIQREAVICYYFKPVLQPWIINHACHNQQSIIQSLQRLRLTTFNFHIARPGTVSQTRGSKRIPPGSLGLINPFFYNTNSFCRTRKHGIGHEQGSVMSLTIWAGKQPATNRQHAASFLYNVHTFWHSPESVENTNQK